MTNLDEWELQRKASLRALVTACDLKLKELKPSELSALEGAFPHLAEKKSGRKESPSVYHWPGCSQAKLFGLAICDVLLKSARSPILDKYREQNTATAPFAGSKALFDALYEKDYWDFTGLLAVDPRTRRTIAIELGLGACYIWPKETSQFAYICRSSTLIDESRHPGCLAVGGAFIVQAREGTSPYVEHGAAWYLLQDRLIERGEWKSRTFAVNDAEFVILYERSSPQESQSKGGVISVKCVYDDVVIGQSDGTVSNVRGIRAFRGFFYSFKSTSAASPGEFYCEELNRVLTQKGLINQMISSHATRLLGQLRSPLT